jgi:flagella basal body P-ring formation protein FlgA
MIVSRRRCRWARVFSALLLAGIACGAVTPSKALPAQREEAKARTKGVVSIVLPPTAEAARSEVMIGDVTTIEGGDAAVRKRIGALDLADAPELGKTTRLTQALIAHRIRIAGIDSRHYSIQGADAIVLSTRGNRVSEQEIVSAARQFLLTKVPWNPADVSIEVSRPIRNPVHVAGSRDDLRFEASLRSPQVTLGTVRVDVSVISRGVKQAEVSVSLEIHLCRTIAVAARRIDRGQLLTEEDVFFERRAVDNIAGFLTEPDSPVGKRIGRTLVPLQPITKTDVDAAEPDTAIVIRQRDAVKIVARGTGLVISATGEALQDGRTGQMIRVRNVDSKAVVTGRVINSNEVQVVY